MKKLKITLMFVLILSIIANVAIAKEGIWYDTSDNTTSISANFYTAASNGKNLCLCDMTNYVYTLISENGEISSFPSVTVLQTDGMSQVYRSCLAIASKGDDYYSIELTIHADMTSMKFEKAELYKINFENNGLENIAELDLSEAYITNLNGSQTCLSCVSADISDNWLHLVFEVAPDGSTMLTFDTSSRERFLLAFQIGDPSPKYVSLGAGAQIIETMGNQIIYALPSADSNDVQIKFLDISNNETTSGPVVSNSNGRPENFTFNMESNLLYYSIGGQIWEMTSTGESTLVASLPIINPNGIFLLSNGQISAWSSTSIASAEINHDAANTFSELSIYGSNEYIDSFSIMHSGIMVTNYQSETSIVDSILTRSPQPDVLILNTFNDAETFDLIQRGYLKPLNSNIVKETIDQMYPEIIRTVTVGNDIIALPFEHISQSMFGVNIELWDTMELGDFPKTWEDMLSFLKRWPEIQSEYPEVRLFIEDYITSENIDTWILSMIISDYECYRQGTGDTIGYNTETFRNLLSQYLSIDFDNLLANQGTAPVGGLLTPDYYATIQVDAWEGIHGLPLRIDNNAPTYMPTTLSIIAINPYTQNLDAAISFVEYVAQNMNPIMKTELMPNVNMPIRYDNYQQDIEFLSEKVITAQDNLSACEDASERILLEQQLEDAQSALDEYELNGWRASEDSISEYRKIAEHIYVLFRDNIDLAERQSFNQVCARFAEGNLPMEQFINELERRYIMRSIEQG